MTLACEKIEFGYRRGAAVLRGVSAAFEGGAITAIVGPNGAGKSTLLRLLLGVRRAWTGNVTLDGRDVAKLAARVRAGSMAYVPQRGSVAGAFTARQVVALGRFALARDDDATARAMQAMEIGDRANDLFGTLSAGQQQRVTIARALGQLGAGGPAERRAGGRVLLADEPVSAMDPRHALDAMAALRSLAAEGVAVGVVLHDLTIARRCADAALVLSERGEVVAFGPVGESLTPEILAGVFRTEIELVHSAGGPALLPRPRPRPRSGDPGAPAAPGAPGSSAADIIG